MNHSSKKEQKAFKAEYPIVYKRIGQEFEKQRVVVFTNENESSRSIIKDDALTFTVLSKRKFSINKQQLRSIIYHMESSSPDLTIRLLDTMVGEHTNFKYIIIYHIEMSDIDDGLEKIDSLTIQTPQAYFSKNAFDTYQQYNFLFGNQSGDCIPYMNYLKYQNINRVYAFSHHMYRNLRHFLFNNMTDADMENILIFSSCTLWLNGVRDMNDIDVLCWKPLCEMSHTAQKALTDISQNKVAALCKKNGDSFVDISIKETTTWPHYWDVHLDNWARECGATSFDDIISDRKYHICFLGIKVTRLEVDIERRIIRNRSSSLMDLIMLRDIVDYGFYIPSIPLSMIDYKKKKYHTPAEIIKLVNDGYVDSGDELYKRVTISREQWLKTIKSYGKNRYKKEFSTEELDHIIPRCEVLKLS